MSVRCIACKQLKTAEDELRKAQNVMRDQSLAVAKHKRQIQQSHARAEALRTQLAAAIVDVNRLSAELSAKSTELREWKNASSDL